GVAPVGAEPIPAEQLVLAYAGSAASEVRDHGRRGGDLRAERGRQATLSGAADVGSSPMSKASEASSWLISSADTRPARRPSPPARCPRGGRRVRGSGGRREAGEARVA